MPARGASHDPAARPQEVSAASAEARASKILHGLGFTEVMLRRATRDFSGGARPRAQRGRHARHGSSVGAS
jgi:ATPase subunit of ABC transporter with duplicated ATPase domains